LENSDHPERYRQTIRRFSDRLVEMQHPIRILDAIKWDTNIQAAFFAQGCRELPAVDPAYYEARPLGFDPAEKRRELQALELDIRKELGEFNPVGSIMRRMCQEYNTVVRMLEARGLPEFTNLSQQLYGGANDAFHAGDPTLADLAALMTESLTRIDQESVEEDKEKAIPGEEAVTLLQDRLNQVFEDPGRPVRVMLSDGIVSDAAAGSDYLKIRREARFSERDLRLLEIHEGWVHVGTTLNGMSQPVCTFLSKGPPSSTVTQEGLAILMEIMAFASYPERLRRLTNRIHAVAMAQDDASFLDVFRALRGQGFSETQSYLDTVRVFRGSTPTGGPFTKDVSYSRGFVLVYNFIQIAVRKGMLRRIPLLFCGKTTLEDVRTVAQLVDENIVVPPKHLPPQFADLSAMTAWMCYSNFLARLNLDQIEVDYANIF
jgi:uncharacterized protein (TIGR02421 family)